MNKFITTPSTAPTTPKHIKTVVETAGIIELTSAETNAVAGCGIFDFLTGL